MSFITTEHRLRCDEHNSCWVTLSQQEKWSVLSVEFTDGRIVRVDLPAIFETEEEALTHARSWVCTLSGLPYE
jgi:hypothetical protein